MQEWKWALCSVFQKNAEIFWRPFVMKHEQVAMPAAQWTVLEAQHSVSQLMRTHTQFIHSCVLAYNTSISLWFRYAGM